MIPDGEKKKLVDEISQDFTKAIIKSHVKAVVDSSFGDNTLPNLTKKTTWQRYANWIYQKMTGENPHQVVDVLRANIIQKRFEKNMEEQMDNNKYEAKK